MRKIKNSEILFVTSVLMLLLTIVTLVTAESSRAPPANIELEKTIYKVNEQGELTIQLIGTMTSLIASNCKFELAFPNDFELKTMESGQPVLEVDNTGFATEVIQEEILLFVEFTILTHDSTFLPRNYVLDIKSSKIKETREITPTWPKEGTTSEIVGMGAPSYPYITSYVAYNRNKGESAKFRTYIYNPSPIERQLNYLDHTIDATVYTDFDETIRKTHEVDIMGYTTYQATDYVDSTFTSGGEKFALNLGSYEADVYANGRGWSDTDDDTFNINLGSRRKVFVAGIICNNIPTSYFSNHFSSIQTNDMHYHGNGDWYVSSFSNYFDTDLIIDTFSSSVQTSGITSQGDADSSDESEWIGFSVDLGKDVLGLPSDWNNGNGWDPDEKGTYASNHGYDLLVVYIDETWSHSFKGALGWQNTILVNFNDQEYDSIPDVWLLHELFHTYMDSGTFTEHLYYNPVGYTQGDPPMGAYYDYYLDGIHRSDFIMESSPEDWYLYSDDGAYETTESRVTARINHYDGPGDH